MHDGDLLSGSLAVRTFYLVLLLLLTSIRSSHTTSRGPMRWLPLHRVRRSYHHRTRHMFIPVMSKRTRVYASLAVRPCL
ncbi:hypothetical protein BDP55DRAFT_678485 [Colletotrichum godetiae]|uniref:Uncharacterized protein n=1 Tax=Colletotrichum godetiae TaxID=1209918 RepID=A0AAJ0AC32_9PEZI|nr:uncharacterized protein BDP55DRAFT_678485 [Colletotrichum godetiae]KAK1659804.1 hypothetical protein BDP55DRAFT_678485 [Colletotrichum godetiae]